MATSALSQRATHLFAGGCVRGVEQGRLVDVDLHDAGPDGAELRLGVRRRQLHLLLEYLSYPAALIGAALPAPVHIS